MANYMDHLLILDEAQMGKVPGISPVHLAINANKLYKNANKTGMYSHMNQLIKKVPEAKKAFVDNKKEAIEKMKKPISSERYALVAHDQKHGFGSAKDTGNRINYVLKHA